MDPAFQAVADALRSIVLPELFPIALGIVLLTIGAASAAALLAHKRARNISVAALAVFTLLYGARLLLLTASVPLVLGLERLTVKFASASITYAIPIPVTLFWRGVVSQRWHRVLRWLLWSQMIFAVVAITTDFVVGYAFTLGRLSNLLVIVAMTLFAATLIGDLRAGTMPTDVASRTLLGGFGALTVAALYGNIAGFGVLPEIPYIEAAALAVFLATAVFFVVRKVFDRERRLIVLDTEMEQARQIQMELLPQSPPAIAGANIAARYAPMRSVAGDFYEFVKVKDGRVGVLVADVCGHGVAAALLASMIKTAMLVHREAAGDPGQLLSKLNSVFCGQLGGKYLTAEYAVFDAANGKIDYCGAGHPPLLLCSTEGAMRRLENNGLPLGLFAHATYEAATAEWNEGECALMYTDGIIEAASATQEQFGAERMVAAASVGAGADAATAADAVLRAVKAWEAHADEQSDDLTLVVVRRGVAVAQNTVQTRTDQAPV